MIIFNDMENNGKNPKKRKRSDSADEKETLITRQNVVQPHSENEVNAAIRRLNAHQIESDIRQRYHSLLDASTYTQIAMPRKRSLLADVLSNPNLRHSNELSVLTNTPLLLSSQIRANNNINATARGLAVDGLTNEANAVVLQSLAPAHQQIIGIQEAANFSNILLRNSQTIYAQRASDIEDYQQSQQQKARSCLASNDSPYWSNNRGDFPCNNLFNIYLKGKEPHLNILTAARSRRNEMPFISHQPNVARVGANPNAGLHSPVNVYMKCDDEVLLDYQIMLRKQIEYFAAGPAEVQNVSFSRRRIVKVGQVGIRCKHCAQLPPSKRGTAATYYPSSLQSIYQAGQNMAIAHILKTCQEISEDTKKKLMTFREGPSLVGHGGKKYWAECAKAVGIVEHEAGGLVFK